LGALVVAVLVTLYYIVLRTDRDLDLAQQTADLGDSAEQGNKTLGSKNKLPSQADLDPSQTNETADTGGDEVPVGHTDTDTDGAGSPVPAESPIKPKSQSEVLTAESLLSSNNLNQQFDRDFKPIDTHAITNVKKFRSSRAVKPNVTYKLKILINFLQIGTGLAFVVDIPWPSGFKSFMTLFAFVNLDFVPWQSLGCATKFTYFTKYQIAISIPVGVMLLLFFLFLLPMYVMDATDMSDDESKRSYRKRARRKFWKLALFTLFLIYPNECSTVLDFFVCKKIGGPNFLLSDFKVQCYDTEWVKNVPYAIAAIVVYPVGVPLGFLYFLRRYRKRLHEPGVRIQLGFLYEAYATTVWYYEIIEMIEKLTMVALLNFLPFEMQMPGGLVVVCSLLMFILVQTPYLRSSDDRLAQVAQTELFHFILCGYVLLLDPQYDSATDGLLSALLISLCCIMFAAFIVVAVKNFRVMALNFLNTRRLKIWEEQEAETKAREEFLAGADGDLNQGDEQDFATKNKVEVPSENMPDDEPSPPPVAPEEDVPEDGNTTAIAEAEPVAPAEPTPPEEETDF